MQRCQYIRMAGKQSLLSCATWIDTSPVDRVSCKCVVTRGVQRLKLLYDIQRIILCLCIEHENIPFNHTWIFMYLFVSNFFSL